MNASQSVPASLQIVRLHTTTLFNHFSPCFNGRFEELRLVACLRDLPTLPTAKLSAHTAGQELSRLSKDYLGLVRPEDKISKEICARTE
jgi:hypothetical protein